MKKVTRIIFKIDITFFGCLLCSNNCVFVTLGAYHTFPMQFSFMRKMTKKRFQNICVLFVISLQVELLGSKKPEFRHKFVTFNDEVCRENMDSLECLFKMSAGVRPCSAWYNLYCNELTRKFCLMLKNDCFEIGQVSH